MKSYPKKFVSDAGKAILIGAIKAFSGFLTIEDDIKACETSALPPIYVRIDVALFIKLYAILLKSFQSRAIRVFYKAVIGLLIKVRDPESVKKIQKRICSQQGVRPMEIWGETNQRNVKRRERL